jgi:hypothetical protein
MVMIGLVEETVEMVACVIAIECDRPSHPGVARRPGPGTSWCPDLDD